ncbi:hypothetical protein DB347_05005 [Opitutaceae bacterium EW11]|nr:hypothetical protein DB347_05005 [Opitutaceae bacterium EW11]
MSPFLKYLFGPEAYWLLVCVAMKLLGARNLPPTEEGSRWLENFWTWLPLIAVPLTFAALFTPGVSRGWLMARIALSAAIGVCVAAGVITGHIDYKDTRNSGVPMGWVMATIYGWAMIAVCSALAGIVLWFRNRN